MPSSEPVVPEAGKAQASTTPLALRSRLSGTQYPLLQPYGSIKHKRHCVELPIVAVR